MFVKLIFRSQNAQMLVKTDKSDILCTLQPTLQVQATGLYKIFLIYIFGVFTQFIGPSL